MQHTEGARASVMARVWQFARRRPRLAVYSLTALIFVVWAAIFAIQQKRAQAAQEAFERSPEGRAQAAAQDQAIADKVDLDLAPGLVQARLRDPSSAQFLDVHMVHRSGAKGVCGYVNARNGLGGMAGNTAFAVFGTDVVMANDAYPNDLKRLDALCYGR